MGTRVGYNSNTRWDLRGNSRLATIHAADKESRDKGGGVGDVVAVSVVRAWTRDNRYTLPQNGESNAMRHKAGRQRQGKSQRIVCFLMTFYVPHADIYRDANYVTAMAAVAGAVADEILSVMRAAADVQLSSDAADALGILAKQPTNVSVVALRSRTVPEETPEAEMVETQVIEESLDPIQKNAETAIASADTQTPTPKPSNLIKPYLQIGIFGVEANARRSVSSMTTKGLSASMSKLTLNNKPFWRVIVGPAATTTEMAAMRKTVTDAGFADAYAVKN